MKEKLLSVLKAGFFTCCICIALLVGTFLTPGSEARAYDEDDAENSIPVEITDIKAEADPGTLADDGFIVGGTYHINVTLKNVGSQTVSLAGYRLEPDHEGTSIDLEGKLLPNESKSYTISGCKVGKYWGEEFAHWVRVKNPPDYEEDSASGCAEFLISSRGKPAELATESFVPDNMYTNKAYPFSIKITNKSSSQTAKNIYVVMNAYDDDSVERREIESTKSINPVNGVTATGKGWMINELKPEASVTIEGNVTFLRAGQYDGAAEIICRAEEGAGPDSDDEENWGGESLYVAIREGNGSAQDVPVSSVELDRNRLSLAVGEDDMLEAIVLPENATNKSVSWSSSNPAVAVVDKYGVIDAVGRGKAIITVVSRDGTNRKATCEVTVNGEGVNEEVKVSRIRLNAPSKKIAAGKKVKLTAVITPSNASNKALIWRSGDAKIATVDNNGNVAINKKAGGRSVVITATAADGSGVKGTYQITAMKGVVKKVAVSGAKSVKAGKSIKLKAKVTATKKANKGLKWTSSNKKYATVSSSGKVKTYKAGKGKKVKITAKATDGSGKKASITIKIK